MDKVTRRQRTPAEEAKAARKQAARKERKRATRAAQRTADRECPLYPSLRTAFSRL